MKKQNIKTKRATITKSDKIRTLFDKGKSMVEISKALSAHYSFVYTVVSKYKAANKK